MKRDSENLAKKSKIHHSLYSLPLHFTKHLCSKAMATSTMSESGNNGRDSAEALSHELLFYCSSRSLSEEGLREIIERRRLTPNNDLALTSNNYRLFRAACRNERVTEGVIRCLIEYFPTATSHTSENGRTPLHVACFNRSMTREIIQLLIDAAPDSLRSVCSSGLMPLHCLCGRTSEATSIQLLKLLIEKCPEAARHADRHGRLPIHIAAQKRSPEFCHVLIEAYPGSEQIARPQDDLPLHHACGYNTLPTVEWLYKLYPDAINHAASGTYPIHNAIYGLSERSNPESAIDIVRFLLDCDPNVKLQKCRGMSLLCYACLWGYNDSKIGAALEAIKVIYDAQPEAIEDNVIASNIQRYHQRVQSFLNGQLVYARQARDHRRMMTPDDNARLPLHRALQNNASLGSIKLLVKGNPTALQSRDNDGAFPLHIACEHHDSVSVVEYLVGVGLDTSTLDVMDNEGDTALHYACRGAKYETIALLLDEYDAVTASKPNSHKKLPIDLLWESNSVGDRESVDYTESVFRLLRECPEMVMGSNVNILTGQVKNLTLV